ncbi:MAG: AAA family ATPase [Legionella sp.]|nr:AAA family ATPase [Legionella sp.]
MPNTIFFWDGAIGDKEIIAKYGDVIEKLFIGDHKSIHLEKLRNHNVYSVRLNKADRLLFTTHKVGDKSYLLILDVVLEHNYPKSRFLGSPSVLKNFMIAKEEALLEQITAGDFIVTTADFLKPLEVQEGEELKLQYVRMNYFSQKFIVLNENQEEARTTELPVIITGAAGSGKTCVAKALLEQCRALQNPEGLYLYVTASEGLASSMKTTWEEVPAGEGENPDCVHFMSYKDLLKAHVDEADKKIVDETYCRGWLENYIRHYRKTPAKGSPVTPDFLTKQQEMQEEFRIICSSSQYMSLGGRQSLFHDKSEKIWLETAFQAYMKHLQTSNLIDPPFYPLEIGAFYDVIVVDEAQDLSQLQLDLLAKMAKDRQIAFCTDSQQSLRDSQSKIPFLQSLVQDYHGKINQIDLPSSHRCPLRVIKAANAILSIKNILREGTGHKGEYVTISLSEKLQNEQGYVQWLTEKSQDDLLMLRERAMTSKEFAVVAPPEHLDEAIALFKRAGEKKPRVFTPKEIKGLQYKSILAFRLFDTKTGFDANRTLADRLDKGASLDEGTSSNRPKQQTDDRSFAPYLSQLFTAYTRATHSLYIYEKTNRKTQTLIQSVQSQLQQLDNTLPPAEPAPIIAATRDELLQHAAELRQNGNIEQAQSIEDEYQSKPVSPPGAEVKKASTQPVKKSQPSKKAKGTGKAKGKGKAQVKTQPVPATVPVKLKFEPTKEEKAALKKLDKNFTEQNIRPLFKNEKRAADLIINAPFKGEDSIFIALIKDTIHDQAPIILTPHRLRMLRFFESKYITATGAETSLFYQAAKFIDTDSPIQDNFRTKQFAQDLPASTICETYSKEDNASALYWLSFSAIGCQLLGEILKSNPAIASKITMATLTQTLTNQGFVSSALYRLSAHPEGIKVLNLLLEYNPELAKEFNRGILFDHPDYIPFFTNMVAHPEGKAFLKKLFTLNPLLAKQIQAKDLCDALIINENLVTPPLYCLGGYEDGREILTLLFDANPEIPKQISGADLTRQHIDVNNPAYSAFPLYILVMDNSGILFLHKLLDLNPQLIQQISGKDLTRSVINSEDNKQKKRLTPLYCLVEYKAGRQMLNRLIKENPDIAPQITHEDLCGIEGCNVRNLYFLAQDEEGCQFLSSLLTLNPDLAQQFTVNDFTQQLQVIIEHQTVLESLVKTEGGCKFLITLFTLNKQLFSGLLQSPIDNKLRERLLEIHQLVLANQQPESPPENASSTLFGFFKGADPSEYAQIPKGHPNDPQNSSTNPSVG